MCVGEHERIARLLGMTEKQVNDVLAGIDHMDIPENERILLEFCMKSASKENYKITQKDIDKVRDAGYSDFQILEATAIVGYFNYINTISNTLGAGK
jgi:alkylhydroperoxidase family enzyme